MPSAILVLLNASCALALAIQQPILRFTDNGTFQIAVFSDLHYGEAENETWGPAQDTNSTRVINTILAHEQPHLAVLNGDLITGENTYERNASAYIDQIVAPLVSRDLYWASTYGNHDSDFNLSHQQVFAREKRYAGSLTQSLVSTYSEQSGVSNYYLLVYSANRTDMTPKLVLWFFDSRGGRAFRDRDRTSVDGYVDESVVNWFTTTRNKLNSLHGVHAIPSLAFFHIPLSAMLAFQQGHGVHPHKQPGINDDEPLAEQGPPDGSFDYTGFDKPFMKALVETEGLIATFSGHDHGDDWCFKWNSTLPQMSIRGHGVVLCFDRHTGYGGYGSWTRGSRQILLREDALLSQTETWVRLEQGEVSGKVTLNSSYGQDSYDGVWR